MLIIEDMIVNVLML